MSLQRRQSQGYSSDSDALDSGPSSTISSTQMPQPTEAAPKRRRKFIVQPIETYSRSSKDSRLGSYTTDIKEPSNERTMIHQECESTLPYLRRESLESSTATLGLLSERPDSVSDNSHIKASDETKRPGLGRKQLRRFRPELVETSKVTSRRARSEPRSPREDGSAPSDSRSPAGPRKFAPQLIETASRSFRRRQTTNFSYDGHLGGSPLGHSIQTPHRANSIDSMTSHAHAAPESRFSYSSLLRRQESRRHSFRVLDLPAIPSSSSEGSGGSKAPSPSTSASASSDECTKRQKTRNWYRVSCDEKFSGFLLSLAAQSAEKQLKEQALAAFPNEQVYQSVAHFAIDREDEDSSEEYLPGRGGGDKPPSSRRGSSANLPWELEYMRRHKEEAERKQQAVIGTTASLHPSKVSAREPMPSDSISRWRRENGLTQMKCAASPPMLGGDLVFPQSLSPGDTLHENDNTTFQSQRMQEGAHCRWLWSAETHADSNCSGLWMGTCRRLAKCEQPPSREDAFMATVDRNGDIERDSRVGVNPMDGVKYVTHPVSAHLYGEPHPMDGESELGSPDDIDSEFHDGFVTQIYNYLSLGYPCVARYYDYELSKTSGIPLEDLRRDDVRTGPKGYITVAGGATGCEDLDKGVPCMRWVALRLYIHDWARRRPKSPENGNIESWGVCERKGSWAF
ncbi:hypothetical protein MAP00_004363 [Monascus purpureus]|nr:hypothetical protein MAP00_004363 [Monascus purpureus]